MVPIAIEHPSARTVLNPKLENANFRNSVAVRCIFIKSWSNDLLPQIVMIGDEWKKRHMN